MIPNQKFAQFMCLRMSTQRISVCSFLIIGSGSSMNILVIGLRRKGWTEFFVCTNVHISVLYRFNLHILIEITLLKGNFNHADEVERNRGNFYQAWKILQKCLYFADLIELRK